MVVYNKSAQLIGIDKLIPYHANAKKHPKEQIDKLASIITEYGFQQPILVDKNMVIIAGHGRLQAAQKLGLKEVPYWVADNLSEAQVKGLRLADNRVAESEWDLELLKLEFAELNDLDFDLDLTGFSIDEIDLDGDKKEVLTDEDAVPEVKENEFGVQRGDIWQLGDHRLMCGDSTSKEDVDRLMNGEKADMVFTDPPYGISLKTNYSDQLKPGKGLDRPSRPKNYKEIENDDRPFDPTFILDFFSSTKEIFLWGPDNYTKRLPDSSENSWICWDKKITETGDKTHIGDFELCWSKQRHKYAMVRILWAGVFGHNKKLDGDKRVHPTQKPVTLAETFFERWGKDKNLIIDLFLGSGSTLIACEKTGRECYGMEIDPHYCSVIIKRWQDFSGKTAVKL